MRGYPTNHRKATARRQAEINRRVVEQAKRCDRTLAAILLGFVHRHGGAVPAPALSAYLVAVEAEGIPDLTGEGGLTIDARLVWITGVGRRACSVITGLGDVGALRFTPVSREEWLSMGIPVPSWAENVPTGHPAHYYEDGRLRWCPMIVRTGRMDGLSRFKAREVPVRREAVQQ